MCHRRWRIDDAYMALALLPLISRTVTIVASFMLNPDHDSDPVTLEEAAEVGMSVEDLTADRILSRKLLIPGRISYALLCVEFSPPLPLMEARGRWICCEGISDLTNMVVVQNSLWILKLCLLTFYSRFVGPLSWGKTVITGLWWFILATFCAVLIATLTECQPLYLYVEAAPFPVPEQRIMDHW